MSENPKPCPICSSPMRLDQRQGIHVDCCDEHGIWFDKGELEALLRARSRRKERFRKASVRRARKDGAFEGALHGWWALLDD